MANKIDTSEIIATSSEIKSQLVGGLRLPEHKVISTSRPIFTAPIANELVLPLTQHIGKQAKPVVNIGDQVLKGQCIAEQDTEISAKLHAPTSGKVIAIEPRVISHPSGLSATCIVIASDQQDKWCKLQGLSAIEQQNINLLQEQITQAGIVGLGGAGFPTAVKLKSANLTTLIINAAECEPYITADDMLLRTYPDEVISGAILLMRTVNVQNCIIGIEENKPEAIKALANIIASDVELQAKIKLQVIPAIYPSGGEKQLIKILTGKEVPSGKIPATEGIVVHNVATVRAIYQAVVHGKPLISRITTITGGALQSPVNIEVLIGTKLRDALATAGLIKQKLAKLIIGGPMMGFTASSLEIPLIKTSNCVIAGTEQEFPKKPEAQECIRCGYCADVCPASLLPQKLLENAKIHNELKLENYNLFDCIECGLCSYVCPSDIPLVNYYKRAKQEIRRNKQQKLKSELSKQRFENRLQRLKDIKQQRELKRKQLAEKRKQTTNNNDEIQAALARVQAKKQQNIANAQSANANNAQSAKNNIKIDLAKKRLKNEFTKLNNTKDENTIANIKKNIIILEQQINLLQNSTM